MSIARHHAEWLSLLEISGPFLSMPVLMDAFPQGLDKVDTELKSELRLVYEEWLDNQRGLRPDPDIHRAWVEWVLRNLLEMPDEVLVDLAKVPNPSQDWTVTVAEHAETLQPDFVIRLPADNPRLLVQIVPDGQDLEKALPDKHWKASPATRMMTLLHATSVRLGLVTNGERWMLVDAPKGETTGFISWYTELWLQEPLTLQAFHSLLNVRRFFGVPDDETIEALLAASTEHQHEVTDQLGAQVRYAVEVLVQAIDQVDQDQGRTLLTGVSEERLYEAAVTVMMRLVFLLSAEERELLPLDDPLYSEHYAVSTMREQLQDIADKSGEEILERRHDAWCRLLATFRAVHSGIQHDRLHLPAYGGSLFDPDRFPFLEGRPTATNWDATAAEPLAINNRTVLHLLDALQRLRVSVPGGGPAEARRLSFRALDIEQIGHVYEGLLDHTAKRAGATVVGLQGTKNQEPEISLPVLEEQLAQGRKPFIKYLRDQTGRTSGALRNGLDADIDRLEAQRLRMACGNDEQLYQRVLPFAGLIRPDTYGHPMVIPAGSVYVTAGQERRATGTHYTPRSLTEPIVQHTLEPLVYDGPAEGEPREEWQLRPAAQLLDLKICDMAMGSGAFLVQACRYLSERLVEAWEQGEGKKGKRKKGKKGEAWAALEALREAENADERLAIARRLVTDRCLYGVDKNHLAVEMAKLSLWLITLDRGRPFTFLDHHLKRGDSVIGVDLNQLAYWNLDLSGKPELFAEGIRHDIHKVIDLRRQIEATPVLDARDQAHKAYLLTQAEAITHDLRQGEDMLIASYYNQLTATEQERLRYALLRVYRDGEDAPQDLADAYDLGDLRPFHWQLEFPEVFQAEGRAGFDAFVGNPPFMGGRRIRGELGDDYREILYDLYPGSSGNADLCAFFFLRGFDHLQTGGTLGLIATNTIAQGDTRQTGLDVIMEKGGTIYNATNNRSWPGQANVIVDIVHIRRGKMGPPFVLDSMPVRFISPLLNTRKVIADPYPLAANRNKSFQGSLLRGMGFVLSPEEAEALFVEDSRNVEVVRPYLNGQDLNSSPDQSPTRWVINFFDWPLSQARTYPGPMKILEERVYPARMKDEESRKIYEKMWWQFWRPRVELYETIAPLERVLAIALTSRTGAFAFMPTTIVFSHAVGVFAFEDADAFAVLQSGLHIEWAFEYGSSLKGDMRYTPTDVFEPFPFPQVSKDGQQVLAELGETYHEHRRQVMLARQEGLTVSYNRFHDPDESTEDIVRLRKLHVEMDYAVAAAYGWDDLDLEHDFHETDQGVRFTISQEARWEILDRLLLLNHERYAEEVKAGLHGKQRKTKSKQQEVSEAQKRLF